MPVITSQTAGQGGAEHPALVSVITVVKDGSQTLERAIQSVLDQTYSPIEYIVVDGASTDGSIDIIRSHERSISRWSSEPDSGISDAFNKGIRQATGEWIGILNADDWYESDAVEAVVSAGEDADVVHGRLQYWDGAAKREVFIPVQERLPKEMTINHPTCFVRRSVYERLGMFREDYRYAMDYELMLRFFRGGARFRQLDAVLANMSYGGTADRGWVEATREVRRAQIDNGLPLVVAWGGYLWRILRGSARRALEQSGMEAWVRAYRSRLAGMKKETR